MTGTGEHLLNGDSGAEAAAGTPQRVPVNLWTTDEAAVLVAPLPGVAATDVVVAVDAGTVRITADLRTPAPKDYLLHEWHYGPYERTVELPEGYDGEAEATFANGQLALRVHRGAAAERRIVTVAPRR
jgi:HSP20 family molecular chaperone IbpA